MRSIAALLLMLTAASLPAQDNSCQALFTRTGFTQRTSLPIGNCGDCHSGSTQSPRVAARLGNPAGSKWIRGDEILIWLGETSVADASQTPAPRDLAAVDRHAQAWTSLRSTTAEQMGRVLGKPGQLHRDRACLACHTSLPVYNLECESDGLISADLESDVRLTSGVSCEGCHGTSGDAATQGADLPNGWGTAHFALRNWRNMAPVEKCRHGYLDVRSVASRTRICVSCHVGNAELGRVVTHEMYAAGHPPLPPFELQTFEQQMPKHWREYHEKPELLRQEFEAATGLKPADPAELQARELLVSALITWSESMKLTADLAEQKAPQELVRSEWPEFAQFDCYACHHDLRHDGWRQQAQIKGHPGRPRLIPWPATLAELAWNVTSSTPEAAATPGIGFAEVRQATVSTPFGDTRKLIKAARAAAASAEQIASRLETSTLTTQQQQAVTAGLLNAGTAATLDYDSARQIAWSWLLLNSATADEQQKLFPQLFLQLHQGRAESDPIPGSNETVTVIRIDPALSLPPIAGYDPQSFRAAFETIRKSQSE